MSIAAQNAATRHTLAQMAMQILPASQEELKAVEDKLQAIGFNWVFRYHNATMLQVVANDEYLIDSFIAPDAPTMTGSEFLEIFK